MAKGNDAIFYLVPYDSDTKVRKTPCHYFNFTINAVAAVAIEATVGGLILPGALRVPSMEAFQVEK